jgi:hypothetical protein
LQRSIAELVVPFFFSVLHCTVSLMSMASGSVAFLTAAQ